MKKKMIKCPHCERTFVSNQAVGLHMHRSHGTPSAKQLAAKRADTPKRADVTISGTDDTGDLTITVELQGVKIRASSAKELDAKMSEVLAPLRALQAYLAASGTGGAVADAH